jgi:hypothetical protein
MARLATGGHLGEIGGCPDCLRRHRDEVHHSGGDIIEIVPGGDGRARGGAVARHRSMRRNDSEGWGDPKTMEHGQILVPGETARRGFTASWPRGVAGPDQKSKGRRKAQDSAKPRGKFSSGRSIAVESRDSILTLTNPSLALRALLQQSSGGERSLAQ